jgi:hypothetical protein
LGDLAERLAGQPMSGAQELRFYVRAYSPDTMPMARLAEYLAELAAILGEPHAVHFVRLEAGSTAVVHKVEKEAAPKVLGRAEAVRRGDGPPEAMKAYRRINTLMRDDNASGALSETSGAVIIDFPGREETRPEFSYLTQQGSLDGEVIRVGGVATAVPVLIRESGRVLGGCYADRRLAKQLARRLFEPVRLFGTGRWNRTEMGGWELERFNIDHFQELSDEPLSSVVAALRAVPGSDWDVGSLQELSVIRGEAEEAP